MSLRGKRKLRMLPGSSLNLRQREQVKQIAARTVDRKLETKEYYQEAVASVGDAATSPLIAELSAIANSDLPNGRDGNEIVLKSLSLRMIGIRADSSNYIRVMVVKWNEDTLPQLFEVINDVTGGAASIVTHERRLKEHSYTILADRVVYMDDNSADSVYFTMKPKVNGIRTRYDGVNTGDGYKGRILLLVWSDSGAVAHPEFYYSSVLKYKDA